MKITYFNNAKPYSESELASLEKHLAEWESEIANMSPELKAKAEKEFAEMRKSDPEFDKMVREQELEREGAVA